LTQAPFWGSWRLTGPGEPLWPPQQQRAQALGLPCHGEQPPPRHPSAGAGWALGMPLSAPWYPRPEAAVLDKLRALRPRVPSRATSAQKWCRNHHGDLAWCRGSPARDHHSPPHQQTRCVTERTPVPAWSGPHE